MRKTWFLRRYFKLYHFVALERLKKKDVDEREIHTLIVVVLSTGLLMWAYAILAATTISSSVPGVVGLVCALVHFLSPLLYRFTNKSWIPCNVLLAAGMIHQGTFAFYSGGFLSNILIWYGILPMLAGVICGKRGVITWFITTIAVSTVYFLLHQSSFVFPDLISETGRLIAQGLLVFGWIFLSSSIVLVYSELQRNAEMKLEDQGKKIEDLFRVLFHDLANPLGRVAIGLSIAKKDLPESEHNRGMQIAQQATDSMLQVTQNVRKMYSVRKGKASLDLSYVPFNKSVEYVLNLYKNELQQKSLKIDYQFDKHHDLHLLVEPVSFNNQVLGNILSNAIKFSQPGSSIGLQALPFRDGQFQVEVRDAGIGIPESLMKHLFDINKKTSRDGTGGERGSGFGMHIMKSFIDMYGGNIQIESQDTAPSGTAVKIFLKGEKR